MPNPPSNEHIAEQLADAFVRHRQSLLRHCARQLPRTEDAEELVQETFMRAWEYLSRGNEIQSMKTFLYRVADNLIVDQGRRKRFNIDQSLEELQEKGFDIRRDDISPIQRRLDVWRIMEKLDNKTEADLLFLRYIKGNTPTDIAKLTGEKRGAVSTRLHRTLKKLAGLVRPRHTRDL